MYENNSRDKTKDNLTLPGLVYHSTKSAFNTISKNKKKSFSLLVLMTMCLEASNIFQAYHNYNQKVEIDYKNKIEGYRQETYSKFFREVVNLNESISNEIQIQNSNKWLENKQNLLKLAENNGWRTYFFEYYISDDGREHAGRNDEIPLKNKYVELVDIVDNDNYKVSIFKEKDNGFSIQLNYKKSDACKAIIHPIKNLKKVEVNTLEVDINDKKDIDTKCSYNALNDIRYYF